MAPLRDSERVRPNTDHRRPCRLINEIHVVPQGGTRIFVGRHASQHSRTGLHTYRPARRGSGYYLAPPSPLSSRLTMIDNQESVTAVLNLKCYLCLDHTQMPVIGNRLSVKKIYHHQVHQENVSPRTGQFLSASGILFRSSSNGGQVRYPVLPITDNG